jgi:hypothetical protein
MPHHISRILSGMEEARLRWTSKSSRTSSKISITRVDQLFERNSPFYQWHRTIDYAIRSVRDVSASTEVRYKDIMLQKSEHNDGDVPEHKLATTCQNFSGRLEDSESSQLLVNPELRHPPYQSPSIGITSHPSFYDTSIGICSRIYDRRDEQKIYRIHLFWSRQNQISYAS